MNFQSIKNGFLTYLQQVLSNNNGQATNSQLDPDLSIFQYTDEFNDYLSNELNIDPDSISKELGELMNNLENNETESGLVSGLLGELVKDENVKSAIDLDGSGKISQDEMKSFLNNLSKLDNNEGSVSLKDIFDAANGLVNNDTESGTDEPEDIIDEPVEEPIEQPIVTDGSNSTSGTGGTGGTGGNGGTGNGNGNGGTTPPVSETPSGEKDLSSMTKEELQTELNNAQTEQNANKDKLNSIIDGSDSTLQGMEKTVEDNYKTYQEAVKEVDEQLAQELDTAKNNITTKEDEINKKDIEISDKEIAVSDAQTNMENAEATKSSLETALSSLDSRDTSNMDDTQKSDLESQKEELRGKIEAAEAKRKEAETAYNTAKTELETLKTQRTELTDGAGGLTELKNKMTEVEAKILEAKPELKTQMDAYKNAKTEYDSYKAEATSAAKTELTKSSDRVKEVSKALNEKNNKAETKEYEDKGTYTIDGIDFNLIMSDSELADFMKKYIEELQMYNQGTGGMNGACHSTAQTLAALIMGVSELDFSRTDISLGKNTSSYNDEDSFYTITDCNTEQKALAEIIAQLDAGYPCVTKVTNPSGVGKHFVTVIGYRDGAQPPYKQSDILYLDSEDGKIKYLDHGSGTRKLGKYCNFYVQSLIPPKSTTIKNSKYNAKNPKFS